MILVHDQFCISKCGKFLPSRTTVAPTPNRIMVRGFCTTTSACWCNLDCLTLANTLLSDKHILEPNTISDQEIFLILFFPIPNRGTAKRAELLHPRAAFPDERSISNFNIHKGRLPTTHPLQLPLLFPAKP